MTGFSLLVAAADKPGAADFSDTPLWLSLVKALFLFVYLLVSVLLVIWFERRIIGRMQQRPGPNRNGPFGLLQTLADGMKSMLKEDVRPKGADALIFTIAPVIFASMAFVAFSIMPLAGPVWMFGHRTPLQLTDLPVAALLVLAVAGVAAYGIVLGGWSAGSTYPLLGGLRATAQLISYEIAMGLALVAVFMYSGSMSTSEIVAAQADLWYIIPACVSFVIYVITMVGETNRLPFDLAEGEGEIVGGYFTEYSGMRFAMFFLGEYINMFTVSALATTLFLGGWQAPPGIAAIGDGMFNTGWWGLLWFSAKLWMFMFFFVWLRGTLPRMRYDQFMDFGWKRLIPVALGWTVLVAVMRLITIEETFDRQSLLITLGVITGLLVVAMFVPSFGAARDEARTDSPTEEPDAPAKPAGAFPVPPMPATGAVRGAAPPLTFADSGPRPGPAQAEES